MVNTGELNRKKINMSVQDKIEQKRIEMKQERDQSGKYKKSHDLFLLWGEYPRGWAMIKDTILCIMLMNALIGQLQHIDIASMVSSKTITIVAEARIQPALAQTAVPEVKEARVAKQGEFSAYNSEVGQTDADPLTMASGKKVYAGAIANNCLPFGTKVKVNGKIKVVEDRMNSRYDCGHFDIFMDSHDEAIAFGRKTLDYEVIERQ